MNSSDTTRRSIAGAVLACALAVSLLSPPRAEAQAVAAKSASTAEASGPEAEQVFALLEQGMQHADAGRWPEALAAFEQARAIAPYPNVLFQLARAQHALGHPAQAQAALDEYEQSAGPHNPNQGEAERLKAQLSEPPPPTLASEAPAYAPSDQEPAAPRFPIGPVVTMSAGGAVLIAALTTGLLTNAREDELVRNCDSELICDSKLAEVKDGGKDLKLVTNVLLVTGGAAITAGLLWLLLSDGEPEQQRVQAGLGCTHDGCLGDVKVGF